MKKTQLTIWDEKVQFKEQSQQGDESHGTLTFSQAINLDAVLLTAWKEVRTEEDFPIGQLGLKLKKVGAIVKNLRYPAQAIVLMDIPVKRSVLKVLIFLNNGANAFWLKPAKSIRINSFPILDQLLKPPVTVAFNFSIATQKMEETIGGETYNFKKGFTVSCKLNLMDKWKETLSYIYPQSQKTKKNKALNKPLKQLEAGIPPFKDLKWLDIPPKYGSPIHLEKVGLGYIKKKVTFVFQFKKNTSEYGFSIDWLAAEIAHDRIVLKKIKPVLSAQFQLLEKKAIYEVNLKKTKVGISAPKGDLGIKITKKQLEGAKIINRGNLFLPYLPIETHLKTMVYYPYRKSLQLALQVNIPKDYPLKQYKFIDLKELFVFYNPDRAQPVR